MLSLDHKGSAEVSSKPSRTLETFATQNGVLLLSCDVNRIRSIKLSAILALLRRKIYTSTDYIPLL